MQFEAQFLKSSPQPTTAPRILVLFGSGVFFGAERGNLEALRGLKEEGAEILCIIRDESWMTGVPSALDAHGLAWIKMPYVSIGRGLSWRTIIWRNPRRFICANWRFLRLVSKFKPTHFHAYNQLFLINFLPSLMFLKAPVVFRAGDEPTRHNVFWRATWRLTVRRVEHFVANSEFIATSLRKNGVPDHRITIIYNLPPKRPTPVPSSLDLALPAGARVIVFIGQVAEHKGPHVLLAAFRRLAVDFRDIYLVLAGRISGWSGDAWGRALRDQIVDDPLIARRVKFLGEIENVPELLACSEFLVVPSLFEDPSPNVVMEAKNAGRACIVFPRGGIPELFEDGVDGLICSDTSEDALVSALRRYCESPELAIRHGAHGLRMIGRFRGSEFVERWLAVYTKVAVERCQRR